VCVQGEERYVELGDTVDLGLPGDDTGLKDAMRVISSVLVLSCGGARQKMDKGRGGKRREVCTCSFRKRSDSAKERVLSASSRLFATMTASFFMSLL
jgi:hypothetical protein